MDPKEGRELATILGAASDQIGLALLESHVEVEALGSSLERLSALLSQISQRPEAAAELTAMRAEICKAIIGLQFYDRMAQHLSHVRGYLDGTVEQLQSADGEFDTLNRRLADRLLTDTHRIHLGRNVTTEFLARAACATGARANKGDIDLF